MCIYSVRYCIDMNTDQTTKTTLTLVTEPASTRCAEHRAYDADYCPVCGTARVIGGK